VLSKAQGIYRYLTLLYPSRLGTYNHNHNYNHNVVLPYKRNCET